MKKQSFIKGTIILTIGGFVAKLLGAIYKIPLTNILGSSGMGIYYLVFPMFNLLLVCSSGGVSIAISKIVANSDSTLRDKKYLIAGILISSFCSILFAIVLMFFSKSISTNQGNDLSYLSFVIISPSIIFASLVAVFKSYFQGVENMVPSTTSMIIEQSVKMVVGLFLATKLIKLGIEYAVVGAVIGVTISEIAAFIVIVFQYLYTRKKIIKENNNNISIKNAIKQVMSIAFPNTLMLLIMPLISFIDSFMVVNLLVDSGFSSISATSLYGINNGVVSSLLALPVIITSALATAIIPNLSGLINAGNEEMVNDRIRFFIKITWMLALPIFLYFLIMSRNIISALYNFSVSGLINEFSFAVKLLIISSISIIYNSLLSTLTSILQALNKSYHLFFILFIGLIIRTILSLALIQNQNFNIFGSVFSFVKRSIAPPLASKSSPAAKGPQTCPNLPLIRL
jgi:stage V sporulation protein B